MEKTDIICKATRDTFVRFAIVLLAFCGFGLYFFYDGAIGYKKSNLAYFCYRSFAELGATAAENGMLSELSWEKECQERWLRGKREENGDFFILLEGKRYPLPDVPLTRERAFFPDLQAMRESWSDSWEQFSKKERFPIKPDSHPKDEAGIREQWYAGGICMLASACIVYLVLRTKRREMSIKGSTVTVAGQSFPLSDIERIDKRQWGTGFKGVAYLTVKGKRLKADGMTYGGFDKSKGEPAERWMQSLLARYEGEIIDYEQEERH